MRCQDPAPDPPAGHFSCRWGEGAAESARAAADARARLDAAADRLARRDADAGLGPFDERRAYWRGQLRQAVGELVAQIEPTLRDLAERRAAERAGPS